MLTKKALLNILSSLESIDVVTQGACCRQGIQGKSVARFACRAPWKLPLEPSSLVEAWSGGTSKLALLNQRQDA